MVDCMPDVHYEHPRLAAIYDPLDPDRSDLEVYAAIADEFGARRVLDVGCGTGTFALLLSVRGREVTGVDPAAGCLRVARAKTGAERVRWIHGDATTLPPMQVDLATMTGNVAQAIIDPADWADTLHGVQAALRPGGRLVFETRDPASRRWEQWNRAASYWGPAKLFAQVSGGSGGLGRFLPHKRSRFTPTSRAGTITPPPGDWGTVEARHLIRIKVSGPAPSGWGPTIRGSRGYGGRSLRMLRRSRSPGSTAQLAGPPRSGSTHG